MELQQLPPNAQPGGWVRYLLVLAKKGFKIPRVFLLPVDEFGVLEHSQIKIYDELKSRLSQLTTPSASYAVVCSNEENAKESISWSVLQNKISGLDSVVQNIVEISQKTQQRPSSNVKVQKLFKSASSMAIIEIPPLLFSGLVFTRNPLNGLDETIIEIIEKKTGRDEIQSQQLVFKNGKLSDSTKALLCDVKLLERLVAESSRIERTFGSPISLEWGYDGERILWFSVKLLHSLEGLKVYSNKIARDMLPGIILPLVWSVNTPIVNSSWKRLITELVGKNSIEITKMAKQFYYRAYFNMGIFGDFFDLVGMPRETLEIMMLGEAHRGNRPKMKMNMRLFRYLPGIGLFVLRNLMIARKMNQFLHTHKLLIDTYYRDISAIGPEESLESISKIIELSKECSYNVIVVRLVRSFHHTILKSFLERKGLYTKMEFSTEDLSDVDPKYSLLALKKKFDTLPPDTKESLERGKPFALQANGSDFAIGFSKFLQRFGHLSTSTVDMSKPQWKEDPQLVLSMIKNCTETPESKNHNETRFPKSPSGLLLRRFYRNFVEYEKLSLRMSFLFSYGYALFRKYFLHLGDILREKGYIFDRNDIFYLTSQEIREMSLSPLSTSSYKSVVQKRKEELHAYSDIILPEVIFGEIPPPPLRKGSVLNHLKGLPSSRGYYEGVARIVTDTADFRKIQRGDVLVIPHSDASWTPLFANVGAVVSESGGLLSHCSIIAREYGIPAVVAVEGATRIPDNTRIFVDGYKGDILISQ